MNQPLISVIVPVYNVEKYLDKCLCSLINQTYSNIEIIVVDDGSKDSSGQISDIWAAKDKRIKVLHKTNAGLGMARNTGLENANGGYVLFVDSDDFVHEKAVRMLYETMVENKADTVYCGWSRYYSEDNIVEYPLNYVSDKFLDNEVIDKVLLEMIGTLPNEPVDSYLYMSVWHALYSMKLIKEYSIEFPSEREFISEDIMFHIDYLQRSKRVVFNSNCLYFYRENNMSLTSAYNPQRFDKEIILYKEVVRRLSLFISEEKYLLRLQRMFLGRVRSCIMRATVQKDTKTISEIKKICDNETVQDVLKTYLIKKNPLRHRLFNYCVKYKLVVLVRIMAATMAKRNLQR